MNRFVQGTLALVGTVALTACDQQGNSRGADLLAANAAAAPVTVSQAFSLPVHATATADLAGCNSADGVSVALNGQLALAGIGARLTFYNNQKGTHGATLVAQGDATVIPAGASITVPRQPNATDVRGNPAISLQLVDGSNQPMTSQASLGACGGSLSPFVADFTLPATARATVTSCSNSSAAQVTLAGEVAFETAVAARVTLQDDSAQSTAAASSGMLNLTIIADQGTVQFAKQPVRGGAGGNPWIYLQFLDGSGAPLGQEALVGRCSQLS